MKTFNGNKIVMNGDSARVYLTKAEMNRFGVAAIQAEGDSIRRAKIACRKNFSDLYKSASTPATASEVSAIRDLVSDDIISTERLSSVLKLYLKSGSAAALDVYPHASGMSCARFAVAAEKFLGR